MSNPKTPRTKSGGDLQAIQPGRCVDGAPIAASAVAAVTTDEVGSSGVYIFCDSVIHVRISQEGDLVDNTYPPIDARGGTVIACNTRDRVSVMAKTGEADAFAWICPLES